MKVAIDGRDVDVVDRDCQWRPCFALGFDKGAFTPGVGYTNYHPGGPQAVCWKRHMDGCPYKDPAEGVRDVYPDGSVLVALLDPLPCCDNPDVPNNPNAYRQRCRSCGQTLRDGRLRIARGGPSPDIQVTRSDGRWVRA